MIGKALEERRERRNGVDEIKQDEDEAAGGDVGLVSSHVLVSV